MAEPKFRSGEFSGPVLIDPTPYLGIQWETMGRGPKYDCWGLARLVLNRELGIQLPSFYYADDTTDAVAAGIELFDAVDDPRAGDLALFTRPLHIGIMTCSDHMLHITHSKDARVERIGSFRSRRIEGFFRVRDPSAQESV